MLSHTTGAGEHLLAPGSNGCEEQEEAGQRGPAANVTLQPYNKFKLLGRYSVILVWKWKSSLIV